MSCNSVQSFMIDICNGPPIDSGLHNVCLHPLSRTFTFYCTERCMTAIDFYFVARFFSDVDTIQTEITYEDKRKKLSEDWRSVEPKLLETDMRLYGVCTKICCSCKGEFFNIIRYLDCGPTAYFCAHCCNKRHEYTLFHCPNQWNVSFCVMLYDTLFCFICNKYFREQLLSSMICQKLCYIDAMTTRV